MKILITLRVRSILNPDTIFPISKPSRTPTLLIHRQYPFRTNKIPKSLARSFEIVVPWFKPHVQRILYMTSRDDVAIQCYDWAGINAIWRDDVVGKTQLDTAKGNGNPLRYRYNVILGEPSKASSSSKHLILYDDIIFPQRVPAPQEEALRTGFSQPPDYG